MCQRCGQDERKHLRDRVSPPRTTSGTQSDHWGNCPSALSADLDNLASRGPLRGTRSGRLRKVETNTHWENDPAAPKPRLPRRTVDCSTQPSMRPAAGGIFDPARHQGTSPQITDERWTYDKKCGVSLSYVPYPCATLPLCVVYA